MCKPIASTIFAAAAIAFGGSAHLHAAPAVPAACAGLSAQIQQVLTAVNQSVSTAKMDVDASKTQYAPTYPQASLDQLVGAVANLNGQLKLPGQQVAFGQPVQVAMQQVIVLLHRARYQTVASAGNNHTKESRNTFNAITAAIAKAEAVTVQATRCYLDTVDPA